MYTVLNATFPHAHPLQKLSSPPGPQCELSHVEAVDHAKVRETNAKRGGVLPFSERAGQRRAPLKRVKQRSARCRLKRIYSRHATRPVLSPVLVRGVRGNGAESLGWYRPSVGVPGVLLLVLLLKGGAISRSFCYRLSKPAARTKINESRVPVRLNHKLTPEVPVRTHTRHIASIPRCAAPRASRTSPIA